MNPFQTLLTDRLIATRKSARQLSREIDVSAAAVNYYLTRGSLPGAELVGPLAEALDVSPVLIEDAIKASRRLKIQAQAQSRLEALS